MHEKAVRNGTKIDPASIYRLLLIDKHGLKSIEPQRRGQNNQGI